MSSFLVNSTAGLQSLINQNTQDLLAKYNADILNTAQKEQEQHETNIPLGLEMMHLGMKDGKIEKLWEGGKAKIFAKIGNKQLASHLKNGDNMLRAIKKGGSKGAFEEISRQLKSGEMDLGDIPGIANMHKALTDKYASYEEAKADIGSKLDSLGSEGQLRLKNAFDNASRITGAGDAGDLIADQLPELTQAGVGRGLGQTLEQALPDTKVPFGGTPTSMTQAIQSELPAADPSSVSIERALPSGRWSVPRKLTSVDTRETRPSVSIKPSQASAEGEQPDDPGASMRVESRIPDRTTASKVNEVRPEPTDEELDAASALRRNAKLDELKTKATNLQKELKQGLKGVKRPTKSMEELQADYAEAVRKMKAGPTREATGGGISPRESDETPSEATPSELPSADPSSVSVETESSATPLDLPTATRTFATTSLDGEGAWARVQSSYADSKSLFGRSWKTAKRVLSSKYNEYQETGSSLRSLPNSVLSSEVEETSAELEAKIKQLTGRYTDTSSITRGGQPSGENILSTMKRKFDREGLYKTESEITQVGEGRIVGRPETALRAKPKSYQRPQPKSSYLTDEEQQAQEKNLSTGGRARTQARRSADATYKSRNVNTKEQTEKLESTRLETAVDTPSSLRVPEIEAPILAPIAQEDEAISNTFSNQFESVLEDF